MLPLKDKSKQNFMNIWKSVRAWIFPGFLFATTKVVSITGLTFFHIILHPTVLIYDFHIFLTSSSSFHGFITNQFNNLLPVGLLAQSVECRNSITEVKSSNPVQAWIFSGFLSAKTIHVVLNQLCCSLRTSRFCSLYFGWFDLFSRDPTFTTSRIFVHGFCS